MRTNVVLVDFESVQPDSLSALTETHFKVLVFVGASQSKLPYDLAASMQELGERAEYIKISGNGQNALDFHIAYYLGQLASADPAAYFHVISKDTGFDPLIQHLKSKGVLAGRVKSISDIPLVKVSSARSPTERLVLANSWLAEMRASKPRTVKTLSSALSAHFQKQISAEEVSSIISELAKQGRLSVAGTKVTYPAAVPAL